MIYSNPRMSTIVNDWPIGSRTTTATFSVEVVAGRGERGTRYTFDPKSGKPNATKKLTYADAVRIVDSDDGKKIYIVELSRGYQMISVMQSNMKYQAEVVHNGDPRYDKMLALFETV